MPTPDSRRTPIVGGNWKMNTDRESGAALAAAVARGCRDHLGRAEVVLFPPFPYLGLIGDVLLEHGGVGGEGSVALGAQDVYDQPRDGAFTGEVSTAMLTDVGVTTVLAGHSERRHVIGEDDELVNRKARAVLAAGLEVILCVGETIEQREAGRTEAVNVAQLRACLQQVPAAAMERVVIAYEPVWAIGTGRTATPEDAQAVHFVIRQTLEGLYDGSVARGLRIQYGGSVKPNNAGQLFAQPDIDGGLIGGASLDAPDFLAIVGAAAAAG